MGSKTYTFTLSRAHHVVHRLKLLADKYAQEALQVLFGRPLFHKPGEEQVQAMEKRGSEAQAQIQLAREIYGVVSALRATIAAKNTEHGVSQQLARLEGLRQELKLIDQVLSIDFLSMLSIPQALELLENQQVQVVADDRLFRRDIRVSVVPFDAFEGLRIEKSNLEAQIAALSDEVNDLNRATVTIDLDTELARKAGIS